jgi:hypothetical protein
MTASKKRVITDEAMLRHRRKHGHSLFAPSSAFRWLKCTASVFALMGLQDAAGYPAAEGTVCHTICERYLTDQPLDPYRVGTVHEVDEHVVTVTEDMWDNVDWALEKVATYSDALEMHYEYRVDLTKVLGIPHQSGTADIVAIYSEYVVIADFKFGYVRVDAEDNEQEMLYLAGVIEALGLHHYKRFCLAIIQPKKNSFDEWWVTIEEVEAFVAEAKAKVQEGIHEGASFVATTDGCNYCAIAGSCKARVEQIGRLMKEDDYIDSFTEEPVNPNTLTTQQLGDVLKWRKSIEGFFAAAFEELTRRVVVDGHLPPEGWEETHSRAGNRSYKPVVVDNYREEFEWLGLDRENFEVVVPVSPAELERQVIDALAAGQPAARKKDLKELAGNILRDLTSRSPPRRVVALASGAKATDFNSVFGIEDDYQEQEQYGDM